MYIFSAMPTMKKKAKPKRRETVPRMQRKRIQWSNISMETAMEAVMNGKTSINKTLGRALDPRANGTSLSKLTE